MKPTRRTSAPAEVLARYLEQNNPEAKRILNLAKSGNPEGLVALAEKTGLQVWEIRDHFERTKYSKRLTQTILNAGSNAGRTRWPTFDLGEDARETVEGKNVFVAPMESVVDAPPAAWEKLSPRETANIVAAREAYLWMKLFPELQKLPSAERTAFLFRAMGVEMDAMNQGNAKPDMIELVRLSSRRRSRFLAYYDPTEKRYHLSEPSMPMPETVEVNETHNLSMLQQMVKADASIQPFDSVLIILAKRLPTAAIEAIAATKLKQVRIKGDASLLGLTGFQWKKKEQYVWEMGAWGNVDAVGRSVTINASSFLDETAIAGVLAHELMHVLDFALGKGGLVSSDPNFQQIYQTTFDAFQSGKREPSFITGYSRANAHEFFAECAAAYLNLRPDRVGSTISNVTRADLFAKNPEAFSYFERLFSETLPQCVAERKIVPSEKWVRPRLLSESAEAACHAARASIRCGPVGVQMKALISSWFSRSELDRLQHQIDDVRKEWESK